MKKSRKSVLKICVTLMIIASFILTNTFVYADNGKSKFGKETITSGGEVLREPPKDWNALTATDEELSYYGYPARPIDKAELNEWKKLVGTEWVKPKFEKATRKKSDLQNSNSGVNSVQYNNDIWAGVVTKTYSTNVSGYWTVPSVTVDYAHTPSVASAWIGLGGFTDSTFSSQTLVQAGSDSNVDANGNPQYFLWYEIVYGIAPGSGLKIITPFPNFKKGDTMYVSIYYNQQTSYASFYMVDVTLNQSTTFGYYLNNNYYGNLCGCAEWIIEHPRLGPKSLSNFVSDRFWNCKSGTINSMSYITDAPSTTVYSRIINLFSKRTEAFPGSIGSPGEFTIYWWNYN